MAAKTEARQDFFELSEHNSLQIFVFFLLLLLSVVIIFNLILPALELTVVNFLNGKLYNGGEMIPYNIELTEHKEKTSYLFNWALDIFIDTPQEARYWFSPLVSLSIPSVIIGLALSIIISLLLPKSLGYMRQKVEREIAHMIYKIALVKYGYNAGDDYSDIERDLKFADLRDLHSFVETWNIQLEDLKALHRALLWRDGNLFYRILHINDGINMYMRFYFTVKYSNTVLGLVYMGAAVLIIIIGLRGLKFIPSTQPSLVFFALGLEFSLLITYAFTLMYGRQEEEIEADKNMAQQDPLNAKDYAVSRETENLLRVFIKNEKNKSGS